MSGPRPFLTAAWRDLVFLNYEVDPASIAPLVPAGTELDDWDGRTLCSVVGFAFRELAFRGLAVPFHGFFEEVNLRFYVRRRAEDGWRRGVVFIKELVPRRGVALVARLAYGENYVRVPMRSVIERLGDELAAARYEWKSDATWSGVGARAGGAFEPLRPGSEEEFVTEHYYGYGSARGRALEYRVDHPSWRVAPGEGAVLECDARALYGAAFAEALAERPTSAFLADGSGIAVYAHATLRS